MTAARIPTRKLKTTGIEGAPPRTRGRSRVPPLVSARSFGRPTLRADRCVNVTECAQVFFKCSSMLSVRKTKRYKNSSHAELLPSLARARADTLGVRTCAGRDSRVLHFVTPVIIDDDSFASLCSAASSRASNLRYSQSYLLTLPKCFRFLFCDQSREIYFRA